MKKLPLIQFGDPILRQKVATLSLNEIASKKVQALIKKMFDTVNGIGVGLAAPQVNESLALAVIEIKASKNRKDVAYHPKTVLINPKITKRSSQSEMGWEGCLSCANDSGNALLWGMVPRAKQITVKFLDEHGKAHTEIYNGFTARVFQHEVDHLNGMLFVDRMKDMKSLTATSVMRKRANKKA